MQRRSAALSAQRGLLSLLTACAVALVALLVVTTDRGHSAAALRTTGDETTTTLTPTTEASTTTTVVTIVTDTTAAAPAPTTPTTSTTRRASTTQVTTPATTRTTTAPTIPSTPSVTCNTSSAGSAGQLAAKFCAYRASKGLPTMRRTSSLDAVAQEWANHLAAIHDLVHRGDLQNRVLGACGSCTGWAENIAYAMDVNTIWNGWLSSTVHFNNIVNGRPGEFGFGVAQSSDGYLWAVQNFGRYPA